MRNEEQGTRDKRSAFVPISKQSKHRKKQSIHIRLGNWGKGKGTRLQIMTKTNTSVIF